MRRVWDYCFGGKFPLRGVGGVKIQWTDGAYEISSESKSSRASFSSALQTYRVKEKLGDILFCVTWDGTTEGDNDNLIPIAVNRNSRQLTLETINGVSYTYTDYTDVGDHFNDTRNSNDGSTDETQIVTPMWCENCEIDVMATSYSGVERSDESDPDYTGDPYDLKLIEVSARCWAKVADPP